MRLPASSEAYYCCPDRRQPTRSPLAPLWPSQLAALARPARCAALAPASRHDALAAAPAACPPAQHAPAESLIEPGALLELSCARYGHDGHGVCFADWHPSRIGLVVLVPGALPGERLTARVAAVKRGYATAVKQATLVPHHDAVQPACIHFGTCGGCQLQSLAYPSQLRLKAEAVGQLLSRVGGLQQQLVQAAGRPPLAAAAQHAYRNKMQLRFSSSVWRDGRVDSSDWSLGFLLPGSASVVLPLQECTLLPTAVMGVVREVCRACRAAGLRPSDAGGVLSHLIVRASRAGQLMAVLVTPGGCDSALLAPIAAELLAARAPLGLVSVVHSVESGNSGSSIGGGGGSQRRGQPGQPRRARGAQGRGGAMARSARRGAGSSDANRAGASGGGGSRRAARALAASVAAVWGADSLPEQLAGVRCQISAHSFFQVNPEQAEVLVSRVVEAVRHALAPPAAAAAGGEPLQPLQPQPGGAVVLDLFTGTGAIALALARALPLQAVVGFDMSASSIADARANAAANGLAVNARFVAADLASLDLGAALARAGEGGAPLAPQVVVVDPARAGLSARVVGWLLGEQAASVHTLVYVSCAAPTLARDLGLLCGSGAAAAGGQQRQPPAAGWFELASWQCVDMFPQTEHIETLAVLRRALRHV